MHGNPVECHVRYSTFPFFNNNKLPIFGALLFQPPLSVAYKNFLVGVPGSYELGTYVTGVPGICLVGIPPACVPAPVPTLGVIKTMGSGFSK